MKDPPPRSSSLAEVTPSWQGMHWLQGKPESSLGQDGKHGEMYTTQNNRIFAVSHLVWGQGTRTACTQDKQGFKTPLSFREQAELSPG